MKYVPEDVLEGVGSKTANKISQVPHQNTISNERKGSLFFIIQLLLKKTLLSNFLMS